MMKMIAHRGASLRCQDNSLEGLHLASELGAYAVECDVQQTRDGVYVLFHDLALDWTYDAPRSIDQVPYDELYAYLEQRGYRLYTLKELLTQYHGSATILFDIKLWTPTEEFFTMLKESGHKVICGLPSLTAIETCRRVFPPEQILAFVPNGDAHRFADYHRAGAGIIRLWENCLCEITPQDVKAACPDACVFVMSNDPETGMNGNPASIAKLRELGADGVLLNDIEMALEVRNTMESERG